MFSKAFQRTWVSPIVAVSFAVVGVSGILMLLHIRVMGMRDLHEWMGVMLVIAGAIHLLLNWKVFLGYFRKRSALVALAVAIVLSLGLVFAGAGEDPRGGRSHMGPRSENVPTAAQGMPQQ